MLPELADRQLQDYDRHRPGSIFADPALVLTIAEAYALQFEVARLRMARGEPLAGYKIGCISPAIQAQFGLNRPVFGHVWGTELHRSGVTLDPGAYDVLAIEGEFAVRVAEDIDDPESALENPVRAFDEEFAVIELHNYVIRNPPFTAQELIGNNAIHAGVVLPIEERRILRGPEELRDEHVTVVKNGENLATAAANALPGGPLGSVAELVKHLARYGQRLRRGQIILTGSPLPLYPAVPGDRFDVRCKRLAEVTAFVSEPVSW